jgi:hypothetical protein
MTENSISRPGICQPDTTVLKSSSFCADERGRSQQIRFPEYTGEEFGFDDAECEVCANARCTHEVYSLAHAIYRK